jgi:hypothetical protein
MIDMLAIHNLWTEYNHKHREWRRGQALFNAAHFLYPEQANKLRMTHVDCFQKDDRIPAFLEALANVE